MTVVIRLPDTRAFWFFFFIVLLAIFFIGTRCRSTVVSVAAGQNEIRSGLDGGGAGHLTDLSIIAYRDSLLDEARPGLDDPFGVVPEAVVEAPPPPRAVGPRPVVEELALNAVLYDNVKPMVKISVGDARSEWLGRGDYFRGWRIVAIEEYSVRINQGDRTFVLRAR